MAFSLDFVALVIGFRVYCEAAVSGVTCACKVHEWD